MNERHLPTDGSCARKFGFAQLNAVESLCRLPSGMDVAGCGKQPQQDWTGMSVAWSRASLAAGQALGRPVDVLIGISTLGNSPNVPRALEYTRAHGIRAIGLTGAKGGKMAARCDICLRAPSDVTQFIQESHIMMGHILCDLAEQSLHFD